MSSAGSVDGEGRAPRVLIIGSGWRFTSGISYYTCRLANELSAGSPVSAILMRRLVPQRLYPGRRRVGQSVHELQYDRDIPVYDGVDWFWGRTMSGALDFLREQRPDVVVLQWWTGAVLHTYLRLAREARRSGARVVIECHEVHDTGEARIPLVSGYVRRGLRHLFRNADGLILHSEFDHRALRSFVGDLGDVPIEIAPHGPYDHAVRKPAGTPGRVLVPAEPAEPATTATTVEPARPADPAKPAETAKPADPAPIRLLFFGTIRPYKGLEVLVDAFCSLPEEEVARYRLSVVGETWEGWQLPLDKIEGCRWRNRIELVNRYVTDAEVAQAFADADVVVLPYRRSSSSGPLHIAMAAGLPVVISEVGGLVEAVDGYAGAVLTAPDDPQSLLEGIRKASAMVGHTYPDPRSWAVTCSAVRRLAATPRPYRGPRPATASMITDAMDVEVVDVDTLSGTGPTVTVVIACYDNARYPQTIAAIDSVVSQDYPRRLVVVVDHNKELGARLREALPVEIEIVENAHAQGASGARNTVALTAQTDLVAFLDDDAVAEPGWLRSLVASLRSEQTVGAGGMILPAWAERAPRWFPPEFGWVVGASIEQPSARPVEVRNVWSGSMIVRREPFQAAGGFREGWGKRRGVAEPEDTELCLRLGQSGGRWLFVTSAVVRHCVPAERATLGYFYRRCWSEGLGKARLRAVVGPAAEALTEESRYLKRNIPRAVGRDARAILRGEVAAAGRGAVALSGTAWTLLAFGVQTSRGLLRNS